MQRSFAVVLALSVVISSVALGAPAARAEGSASPTASPTARFAPNLYGQTGVVRTTSARVPDTGELDLSAQGSFAFFPDFFVGGTDSDALVGGHLALSAGLLRVVELSLATRGAGNNNTAKVNGQYALGDMYPSAKFAFTFLPVAVGLDVRGLLPARADRAGLDLEAFGASIQGLFTLDLEEGMGIPVRAHLNAGYVYQNGKTLHGDNLFETNRLFFDGEDGQLLNLAAQTWFYDQATAGLSVEVPLPWATPYIETWYQTALAVPPNRGKGGKAYDLFGDAHLIVTPGVRVTPVDGLALDLAVDVGITGNGGGLAPQLDQLVSGQPMNPLYQVRFGISHSFDLLHGAAPTTTTTAEGTTVVVAPSGATGQVKGCVVDAAGQPIRSAVVEGPALAGARLTTDAAGCFVTPFLAAGAVQLVVSAPGHAASQVAATVEDKKTTAVQVKLDAGGGASGGSFVSGFVTSRESDAVVEADLEITDAGGTRAAGKAAGGQYSVQVSPGRFYLVAKADGFLAQGVELVADGSGRLSNTFQLKKAPAQKKRTAALEGNKIALAQGKVVPFEFKKPRLQSTAEYVLDEVADILLRNPSLRVRVEVYAEPLATPEESQQLADERAQNVVDYLASRGVARARFDAKGVPLPAAEADKGRRVDFVIP